MGTYNDTTGGTKYINFGGPAYQKTPTSDGEQVFAKLNTQGRYGSHGSSLTASDYEQYALEKLGFTFNYLGGNRDGGDTPAWKLSNTFDYIKVTLGDDHTHTYGTTYSSDSTGHWKTCTECGANGEFSKHTGGTATCTAKAVCETCDQPYGELGAHKLTKTAAKAATCTTKGTTTYTAAFKDEDFSEQTKDVDIAATGHDWSNKDGICAVCHTKCDRVHKPGTTCEVCGKYTRRPSTANSSNTVSVPSTPNGTMTVNPSTASKGETVTITTKPSEGYELGSIEVLDKNGDALKLKDLGSGKYSFVMPDGKVSVKAEFVKTAPTSFVDVPANAYFADAVKWAVDKGVTNGLTDTMFGPYESCTRAEIVTFLYRAYQGK